MRLLDLFCGAGGAAMGYHLAGFDVVGVDIQPQPSYPFDFIQGDALEVGRAIGHKFDALHGSPPCQAFTVYGNNTRHVRQDHPNLIPATRALFRELGLPYVIENVPGAPLESPIQLCGTSFPPLEVRRHRVFESNVALMALPCDHGRLTERKYPGSSNRPNGRTVCNIGEWRVPIERQREAIGIDWMDMLEISQAVPPAFTQFIGEQLGRTVGAPVPERSKPNMSEFPYKPVTNGCDICGRSAPLSRVILAAGGRSKLERVAYICDRHKGSVGAPVPDPAGRMKPGTTALRPQEETLM